MKIPTKEEAQKILEEKVKDEYQRYHSLMVATAMEGYAREYGEDLDLWFVTGLLHDVDFEKYPDIHPAESVKWFREWRYSDDLIHAVEAHAYGYNGYSILPKTKLASALMACDELCGIIYAYKKINPSPYGQIKSKSIKKRFKEEKFAAKINRGDIVRGCDALGVELDSHIENVLKFLSKLD
ncbi:MAG: HD domain-containing protein [Candidatus Pacebacteria bacterium]|nr:HD domain-containing protein [Candidatus Paceibacterota bacterium]